MTKPTPVVQHLITALVFLVAGGAAVKFELIPGDGSPSSPAPLAAVAPAGWETAAHQVREHERRLELAEAQILALNERRADDNAALARQLGELTARVQAMGETLSRIDNALAGGVR